MSELWRLGILAKTKHNEVAPAQHELAPIFTTTNLATDHNQLTMEIMKKTAKDHGMACLLHEKPFAGVNGSGKHNNWSISTDTGVNLLDPGKTPYENAQFLLFLSAVIAAVDKNQDLLRVSVATAGNDHRLGANEAPPAIVSMFVGDDLGEVLEAIETGKDYHKNGSSTLNIGVDVLPNFAKDTTDRNRTSPFAFTGNKFEFRMLGSQLSIACPNYILNTIVADELKNFADELEQAEDFNATLNELIKRTITEHKRIIFNGNNYSEEWVQEAERRGLLNMKSTVEALPHYVDQKNIDLFARHGIFTKEEVESRYEILMESYAKTINIEALTMLEMARRDILPAVMAYVKELTEAVAVKKSVSSEISVSAEMELITKLSSLCETFIANIDALDKTVLAAKSIEDQIEAAKFYYTDVFKAMTELREIGDEMEVYTSAEYWPYPTYGEMLFSV